MNALIPKTSARRPRRRTGFTLVEAALTTIIIGLGTVAMMGLLTSGLSVNQQAAMITTAVNLADDIHELCDCLPFPPTTATAWGVPSGSTISQLLGGSGNLSWLNGQTFSPPIDATETSLGSSNFNNWSQSVSVTSINTTSTSASDSLNTAVTNNTLNAMARVTVTISYSGQQMFQTSWIVAR
jgi:Tfp pilus assembly protein PilV